MKKLIYSIAGVGFCLTLFSFSTNDLKKATYNEISNANAILLKEVGSFTKYQTDHYTGDKGTWNTRNETWTLTGASTTLGAIEKSLDKN